MRNGSRALSTRGTNQMRAAKSQAGLCFGINSTEPSLLYIATNTLSFTIFFLVSLNASSESSGEAVH